MGASEDRLADRDKEGPMTDQTPEARLAATMLAALTDTGYLLTHEYADSGVIDVADAMTRADPTLAADLALAAAVKRLPDDQSVQMMSIPSRGDRLDERKWRVTVDDPRDWKVGHGPTLTAAIEEALRDE